MKKQDKRLNDAEITALAARKIRAKRRELGLSQEELGARCDVHRTYIGAVERGEKHITLVTLSKIAAALDEPLVYFVSE